MWVPDPQVYDPAPLSWSGVTARRMASHALTEPTDLGPAEVAGALCGAHTQVLNAAELSIARRIAGAARADVRRALWEDRTLVKTFGVRGTCTCCPLPTCPVDRAAVGPCPRRRGPIPSRSASPWSRPARSSRPWEMCWRTPS